MTLKIAIIGATGAVGREMIHDLESSKIQNCEVGLFASPRSQGLRLEFRGKNLEIQAFSLDALRGYDYALMSAGGAFSKKHSLDLVRQGVTVIDNSSAFRMDEKFFLIVPEVNGILLKNAKFPTIIPNANCSTIQMVVALSPLQKEFGLKMVHVSTYQSVSGTGQKGIVELSTQVSEYLKFQELTVSAYAQPIAFNLLPAIAEIDSEGHCAEELKMVKETQRILNQPGLEICATTVRVPTFNCHGESLHVQLGKKTTRAALLKALKSAPGIALVEDDDHASFPTPRGVTGLQKVFISRARTMYNAKESDWVQMWCLADNLKKGAATNAVQILELILQNKKP